MESDEREPGGTQPMERLEAALKQGLQRRAVPEGLEERILARAMAERGRGTAVPTANPAANPAARPSKTLRMAGLLRFPVRGRRSAGQGWAMRGRAGQGWAVHRIAASVALGAVVAGAAAYYQAEQRRRTEATQAAQTRAEVMEALRITSRTLDRVQDRLNQDQ